MERFDNLDRLTNTATPAVGRVEALWLKRAHRGPMDRVERALLVAGQGVDGSVGRSRRRQVTLFEHERWKAFMAELGGAIDPAARRANIMVSGIALAHTRKRVLRIGCARIEIGGELTPCERMDEALPGLQNAMRANWGGGVFGAIFEGGMICVGDPIIWESEATA
ncbi:MAG TPA: MOSC domain-containing protein [Gemmatimonadaceae bacterium]